MPGSFIKKAAANSVNCLRQLLEVCFSGLLCFLYVSSLHSTIAFY